jgi:Ni,Fe-hydrogenase III large subunit
MSGLDALEFRNRRSVPWSSVPREHEDSFRETVAGAVQRGWRLASFFGMPEGAANTRLVAILADDGNARLGATSTTVGAGFSSLTPACPSAHLFEREIAEQCGVIPHGHPWLKPLRRHPPDHLAPARPAVAVDRDAYPFFRVKGEEVHEVGVGPVHAGIIEPGHFRFQTHGEEVLFLEIMLGYQHRGVERLMESAGAERAVLVAESIAGDTVVGHAAAHCGAVEALARSRKTPRAQAIRGIALELERLANHIGDLGAIAGDVAFQPAASYFGRMRGECLNLLMTISGNRYGRGLLRPGGVLREQCLELGFVGPVARACDVPRDVRHDHPYGIFRFAHVPVATAWAGDVLARALVRWLEIQRSLAFLLEQLSALPSGEPRVACGGLQPNELVVAMEEGWRGEIVHVAITDDRGRLRRYKVTDPSFHNWTALALAMPGNQISDFPLCNKSFNLSYAGHDL